MKHSPKSPGPGSFENTTKEKTLGSYGHKEARMCFIDTAREESKTSPGPQYNLNTVR